MDPKRLREIAVEVGAGNSSEVFAAVAQAAYESGQEMRELYLKCLHGIEMPPIPDCRTCRKELINQGRQEICREIRALLHVKGWDE